jgi:hypothetical protein
MYAAADSSIGLRTQRHRFKMRSRELTPEVKANAQAHAKFFELRKANPGKSEAEIREMVRAA